MKMIMLIRPKFILLGFLLAAPAIAAEPQHNVIACDPASVEQETPRPDPARFAGEIAAFAKQDAVKNGIVFTGSSSIRLWGELQKDFPGLPVLNRGFGGSVANDLIVYFDTLIGRHEPKVIVTYTGSNDIHEKLSVSEAFADYTQFLEMTHERFPKTRVVLTSVKVAPRRIEQASRVRELNVLLKEWSASRDWIRYVDCTSYLCDPADQPILSFFVEDHLHLSPSGYEKWTEILLPVVKEEWLKAGGEIAATTPPDSGGGEKAAP